MAGFDSPETAFVIGASGGIGRAMAERLAARDDIAKVVTLSRSGNGPEGEKLVRGPRIDLEDGASIDAAMAEALNAHAPKLVVVASGILSDGDGLQPEKSYKHQAMDAFERVFRINTFGPGLVAKHAIAAMPREGRSIFAALSARVGSISDNRIGGWHAYRASKAALNMLIRNYAIEQGRRNDQFIAAGLHPGTVDTALSQPFQGSAKTVFTPDQSAEYLVNVLAGLTPDDSGKVFDWDNKEVPA